MSNLENNNQPNLSPNRKSLTPNGSSAHPTPIYHPSSYILPVIMPIKVNNMIIPSPTIKLLPHQMPNRFGPPLPTNSPQTIQHNSSILPPTPKPIPVIPKIVIPRKYTPQEQKELDRLNAEAMQEEKLDIWDDFCEDYHDIITELPLEYKRNLTLVTELDQAQTTSMDSLQKLIKEFVHSLPITAVIPSSSATENIELDNVSKHAGAENSRDVILNGISNNLRKAMRSGQDKVGLLVGMAEAVERQLIRLSSDVKQIDDALIKAKADGTLQPYVPPITSLPTPSQPLSRIYSTQPLPNNRNRANARPSSSNSRPAPPRPRPINSTIPTPPVLPPPYNPYTPTGIRETRLSAPKPPDTNSVLFPAIIKSTTPRVVAPLKIGPDGLPIPKRSHKRQVIDAFGNKVDADDLKRPKFSATATPSIPPPRQRVRERQSRREGEEVDERLYCVCRRISFGEMIACENENCPTEWFHLECVNLSAAPINSTWFCQNCDLANQIRARPTVSQLPPDSLPPHARVGNSPPHLRNSNSPIVTAEPSATGGELKEGEGCVII